MVYKIPPHEVEGLWRQGLRLIFFSLWRSRSNSWSLILVNSSLWPHKQSTSRGNVSKTICKVVLKFFTVSLCCKYQSTGRDSGLKKWFVYNWKLIEQHPCMKAARLKLYFLNNYSTLYACICNFDLGAIWNNLNVYLKGFLPPGKKISEHSGKIFSLYPNNNFIAFNFYSNS